MMFRHGLQPKNLLNTAFAAFLAIILSGAVNLLCCRQMIFARQAEEHCPLTKKVKQAHCDFSKEPATATSETAKSVRTFECCTLKFNFFVAKLEKNDYSPKTPAAEVRNFSIFLRAVKLENKTGLTVFSDRERVFAVRDLHVKNCVFRI